MQIQIKDLEKIIRDSIDNWREWMGRNEKDVKEHSQEDLWCLEDFISFEIYSMQDKDGIKIIMDKEDGKTNR